jgi:hypothetical protein
VGALTFLPWRTGAEYKSMISAIIAALENLEEGDSVVVHRKECHITFGAEFCNCKPVVIYVQSEQWEN